MVASIYKYIVQNLRCLPPQIVYIHAFACLWCAVNVSVGKIFTHFLLCSDTRWPGGQVIKI